jgi:hypothetical protein|nr:MAG TPA: Cas system-associated protein [Bacteriophage sp.]DAQ83994.1 MAG TPA: Cas system-associated protein [Caudoviricetes sp.]
MRVISQDGTKDFPYDNAWVSVYEGCINGRVYVRMQICGYDDSVDVADYSTEEKAKKAMEMLRIAYAGKFITNADIPDDFNETLKAAMKGGFGTVVVKDTCERVEFNNLNGYFHFPAEEELE